MKRNLIIIILLIAVLPSCIKKERLRPEPHLELGQDVHFLGSDPDKTYIIVGYKKNYQSSVEKLWDNQDYVVFTYLTDYHEIKDATVHVNAIIKQ